MNFQHRNGVAALALSLALAAAPAHAQLLGGGLGGGLGGSLNGTLGGTMAGTLGGAGPIGSSVDSVRSGTTGTLRSTASTTGHQNVNRKTGAVHADRSANASGGGALGQVAGTPTNMISGTATGNANGSGTGNVDGQLVGTNAVRGTLIGARNEASGMARHATGTVGSTGSKLAAAARGNASGSGGASGSGDAGGGLDTGDGAITGSGNTGGSADGGFQVTRGMPVLGPDGQRIGKVQRLINNRQGDIEQMLVKVGSHKVMLPAANFTASGNAVTSAMTAAQIEKTAETEQSSAGSMSASEAHKAAATK